MVNVHRSPALITTERSAEPDSTATPGYSPVADVIDFFRKRLDSSAALPLAQTADTPSHAWQRIEHLLRFAVTKERPSVAEQISQRVKNAPNALMDAALHKEVAQLLGQSSALNAEKTYAELIYEILQDPQPSAANAPKILSRSPRNLETPDSATPPSGDPVSGFANAVVDDADRKLATALANSLIRQRVTAGYSNELAGTAQIAIPKESTFGQAAGKDRAYVSEVAAFYGLQLGHIGTSDTLFMIEQLQKEGAFSSLTNTDPLYAAQYAPIKQRQREAKQRLAKLPPQGMSELAARFAPLTAEQKVQEADRELARLCSRSLAQTPWPRIEQIPQYSTLNLARNNLINALDGAAFNAFAQENNLERSSIRIHPVDGTLVGKVNGVETTFILNDLSSWSTVWPEVASAVQSMAAGSENPVYFPSTASASLSDVLGFYADATPFLPPPHRPDVYEKICLRKSAEIAQIDGFEALLSPQAEGVRASSVRAVQQAVTQQLAGQTLPLSPLESLAAAAQAAANATTDSQETSEDTLARAESTLAVAMHKVMLGLKADASDVASATIESIPPNSLFGQWRAYLEKALTSRGFSEWAQQQNIDLSSLRFDPVDNALIGTVEGVDQRFTANDFAQKYPEYFDALTPVLKAAEAFSANAKPISLVHPSNSSAPFEWVANFYSVGTAPHSAAFAANTALMGRTQRFPAAPENLQKILDWLNQQTTALGNSNDRYALINQLKTANIDNDGTTHFIVDPDSSHHPKGATTVQKYLAAQDWYEVTNAQQVDNLLLALQTPIPQSPPLGNNWGFLSTDIALDAEQRSAVANFVKKSIGAHDTLLSYLSSSVTNLSHVPEHALEQLLSSDAALAFATALQTEMKGLSTSTSLKQWLLTACVLDVDPNAGTQRNTVAGFDFMQSDNWGFDTGTIHQRFNQHLTDEKKIPAHLAPVVSRLMMSGMAPNFIVKGLPPSLTLGSIDWFSFTTAVNRVEQTAPGASANMTYQQIMSFHKIKPISVAEARTQAIAQANPVIDWAIMNNHLVKSDKDEYTLDQMYESQAKLSKQSQEATAARSFLRQFDSLPSRRTMALEELREKFGSNIDYEQRYLTEKVGPFGIFSNIRASIVEVYEAGRLNESWRSESTGPDFETFRTRASELPDITAKFNERFEEDYALRRAHTVALFKDMLSQLPLADRDSINNGAVEILRMEGASDGILLVSSHLGQNRAFAINPAKAKIIPMPELGRVISMGHTGKQTLQTSAFHTDAERRQGRTSELGLTLLDVDVLVDPDKHKNGRRPLYAHSAGHDHAAYTGTRIAHLAEVLVDSVYLNKKSLTALQRGLGNAIETGLEPSDYFQQGLRFLPGGSSAVDIYHGEYAEAVKDLAIDIVIYAATEGAGKLWTVAKTGAGWAAAKVSSKFIEKLGAEEAENIALKDVTATGTSTSFNSSNRIQGSPLTETAGGERSTPADRADGVVTRRGSTQPIKVTAVQQDGNWYAYDAKAMSAYGPALDGFVADSSARMTQETFSDGTHALVTEKPLAADAYTIPRAHGFDVINEGKVYRYDTRAPGLLSDLESADHFKPRDDFEAFCPAPSSLMGRGTRGTNDECFVKVIEDVQSELTQELQALEHTRLYPSPHKSLFNRGRYTIFEKRLYKMTETETGSKLVPVLNQKPITYQPFIRGEIQRAPGFGFYGNASSTAFEGETRVVKLGRISTMCDDQREIRGVVISDYKGEKQLVVEADTNRFYRAKLTEPPQSPMSFINCDRSDYDVNLVKKYRSKFKLRQARAGRPLDANFIALPKLNTAYKELEKSGFPKSAIDTLKGRCVGMTAEQQREVAYQLKRLRALDTQEVALRSSKVVPLEKPVNFEQRSPAEQNQFYAQQSKRAVVEALDATGLGPSNLVRTPNDLARADAASEVILWLRDTANTQLPPDYGDLIIKSGVGNCGEMSILSADIINKSGGRAYTWDAGDAHAFTVVGGPAKRPRATTDFSTPEWADAWIVDPWANIACPASKYTEQLKTVMSQWQASGLVIREGTNPNMSPLDPTWINTLITEPKTPARRAYK